MLSLNSQSSCMLYKQRLLHYRGRPAKNPIAVSIFFKPKSIHAIIKNDAWGKNLKTEASLPRHHYHPHPHPHLLLNYYSLELNNFCVANKHCVGIRKGQKKLALSPDQNPTIAP